jgi:hypothetical protein
MVSLPPPRPPHVLVHEGQRHVEVEVEKEDDTREENGEDGEGRILKVCELHLHRAQLHAPPYVGSHEGGGLPPHALPIGALQILKVLCALGVVH